MPPRPPPSGARASFAAGGAPSPWGAGGSTRARARLPEVRASARAGTAGLGPRRAPAPPASGDVRSRCEGTGASAAARADWAGLEVEVAAPPASEAGSTTTGGNGCSPRISSMRNRQASAISADASSPSGKSLQSLAISSGPLSVLSALGNSRRPALSTVVPVRMQVSTSCRGCRRRSCVWTSFTTATGISSRRPTDRAARTRASSPATRCRDTASASRRPKIPRSRAAASPSAPGRSAKSPPARSPTRSSGTSTRCFSRRSGGGSPGPEASPPCAAVASLQRFA